MSHDVSRIMDPMLKQNYLKQMESQATSRLQRFPQTGTVGTSFGSQYSEGKRIQYSPWMQNTVLSVSKSSLFQVRKALPF